MLAVTRSVGLVGLKGYMIEVEVDISASLPGFDIVGLPQTSVKESRERVRAALKNSGFEFPIGRITVNLAPADLKKEGPVFDLPIAVGLLAASGQIKGENYKKYVYLGELSLDGRLKGVTGVLPSVLVTQGEQAVEGVVVSALNAEEAVLAQGINIYPAASLYEVFEFLQRDRGVTPFTIDVHQLFSAARKDSGIELDEVKGHYKIKRALEVAAAGGHNLLMAGPPGSGKTMMARSLARLMPKMSMEEALEVTQIYSVAGLTNSSSPLMVSRPFRSPHHTVSRAAMAGGGTVPRPGELSLSHHGILFLDEFPEFSRDALESLRQPLEDGNVALSRANGKHEYPANIMLVAAMNPCPCGFFGDSVKECICTPPQVDRYRNKISGPLLDRIDIQVHVPRISYEELRDMNGGEERKKNPQSASEIRERIEKAREIQRNRFKDSHIRVNARMDVTDIRKYCAISKKAAMILKQAYEKLSLSARGYNRVLKVARTIADLEGKTDIDEKHIAEAISYRVGIKK